MRSEHVELSLGLLDIILVDLVYYLHQSELEVMPDLFPNPSPLPKLVAYGPVRIGFVHPNTQSSGVVCQGREFDFVFQSRSGGFVSAKSTVLVGSVILRSTML